MCALSDPPASLIDELCLEEGTVKTVLVAALAVLNLELQLLTTLEFDRNKRLMFFNRFVAGNGHFLSESDNSLIAHGIVGELRLSCLTIQQGHCFGMVHAELAFEARRGSLIVCKGQHARSCASYDVDDVVYS